MNNIAIANETMKITADGFYELATGRELAWFSHKVSDEKKGGLNALLKNDITMTDADNALFTGIGNAVDAAFTGTFDGQFNTIDNLKISRGSYAGLICYTSSGATVKNLGIVNAEIISTGKHNDAPIRAGVLAGEAVSSTLLNIYTTGTLTVQTAHEQRCGISGEAHQSTLINCWSTFEGELAKGSITAMTNCYTYTDVEAKKASGELTYLLNGSKTKDVTWYQTLGVDAYPVLNATHKKVYLMDEAYVNDYATKPALLDGVYQITKASELNGFAQIVNGGQVDAKAAMTADIDMDGIDLIPIGTLGYLGTFDGQNFAINNLESNSALFAIVKPGAVISNLTINGTVAGGANTAAFVANVSNAMTEAPVADLLDVVFKEDGTAEDVSPMHNTVEHFGTSSTYYNETYKRYVANFDNPWGGTCTSYYKVDYETNEAMRSALADGHSLEMVVMGDFEGALADVEAKPFSAMQVGGTGFLICKTNTEGRQNEFTFLPNVTTSGSSTWRWTTSGVVPQARTYYHVIGVWNKEEQKSYIYINGTLCKTLDAPGDFKFATEGCNWFCLGGDPSDATTANAGWKGDVVLARAYDKPLTREDAALLWKKLNDETPVGIVREARTPSSAIYDLSGRRVEKPSKGLYIIEGRKVFVK